MNTGKPSAPDVVLLFEPSQKVPFHFTQEQTEQIQDAAGGEFWWFKSEQELLDSKVEADILFTWGGTGSMPERFCASNTKLKWLHSFSAGMDPVMSSEIAKLPIMISNSSGIHSITIAEHVIGLIVAFNRGFPFLFQKQREHVWGKGMTKQPVEAFGKTIGMVGAGAIATETAKRCKAFAMRTIGLRRSAVNTGAFDEMLDPEHLPCLLRESDYVMVATPLTSETRHMIAENELKQMKSTALLINISRGGVIDQDALIRALKNGVIGGAALDVTDPEPLPSDSPLWEMENVIITPHMSADAPILTQWAVDFFCDNIKRYKNGQTIKNLMVT